MIPTLLSWACADHDPIADWVPPTADVYYWLTLEIGAPDEPGADLFSVAVCTPAGLDRWKRDTRDQPTHRAVPPIVVGAYAWPEVLAQVQDRLTRCEGHTWLDAQETLRRHFLWEYEGMAGAKSRPPTASGGR